MQVQTGQLCRCLYVIACQKQATGCHSYLTALTHLVHIPKQSHQSMVVCCAAAGMQSLACDLKAAPRLSQPLGSAAADQQP